MAEIKDVEAPTQQETPPGAQRFLALLQGFDEKQDTEAEWRKLEREWLTAVLHQSVIAFDDVQIAAELMARHRWEDSGSGSPHGRAAFSRLRQLRSRRGVSEMLECWPSER